MDKWTGVAPPARLLVWQSSKKFDGYDVAVQETILSTSAPSAWALYADRLKIFQEWLKSHHSDLVHHPVPKVLSASQGLLINGNSPSTLKVYVVAISAHHNTLLGAPMLISAFLKGARRLLCPTYYVTLW